MRLNVGNARGAIGVLDQSDIRRIDLSCRGIGLRMEIPSDTKFDHLGILTGRYLTLHAQGVSTAPRSPMSMLTHRGLRRPPDPHVNVEGRIGGKKMGRPRAGLATLRCTGAGVSSYVRATLRCRGAGVGTSKVKY